MPHIEGQELRFHYIAMTMDKGYNSMFRQNRVVAYLCFLRINKLMTNNQSSTDSFEKMHDEITKYTPRLLITVEVKKAKPDTYETQ